MPQPEKAFDLGFGFIGYLAIWLSVVCSLVETGTPLPEGNGVCGGMLGRIDGGSYSHCLNRIKPRITTDAIAAQSSQSMIILLQLDSLPRYELDFDFGLNGIAPCYGSYCLPVPEHNGSVSAFFST